MPKGKKGEKAAVSQELRDRILSLFDTETGAPPSMEQIFEAAGGEKPARQAVDILVEEGRLILTRKGRCFTPSMLGMVTGTFWSSGRGFGFVAPDGGGEDLFIAPKNTLEAWHADRVLVQRLQGTTGKGPEGAVQRILSRGEKPLTGRLSLLNGSFLFLPDNRRLPDDIRVGRAAAGSARAGDRVAVRILSYGGKKHPPEAEVTAVFGRDGTREAACAAVLHTYGIRTKFPGEVIKDADKATQTPLERAGETRLDLRGKLIFTIDGADAKDLDDAVSLEKDEAGNLVLGVHIADVSHYVRDGSALDREAQARGTSVYYADRVIPMLPKALSNESCSLSSGTDKLAFSAFITLDSNAGVADARFAKSVIRSSYRMTYPDCNALLAGTDESLGEKYAPMLPTLREMARLAEKLYQNRLARGGLDIETVESYIRCDEEGRPVDVVPRERGASEKLIEEFMLCANEAVARYLSDLDKPAVYRVHEKPDPDKVAAFGAAAGLFGYKLIRHGDGVRSGDLQKVLDAARSKPEQRILSDLLLRSMMKARYSELNLGHYGLAAQYYCHFTSPIRRYPDLVVHRFLSACLTGRMDGEYQKACEGFAASAAASSSDREVAADNVERDIEKLYKAEYMQGHIGEEYDASVSGVQSFGLFVQLPNTVEGLVPVDTMEGDYFIFNEEEFSLTGANTKAAYRIGSPVRVRCVSADPATGEVDFILL